MTAAARPTGSRPALNLRVHDTRTGDRLRLPVSESGRAEDGRELKLYVCGVTPYDSGHLGHAFTFCAFDVLVRWVEAAGVPVRYVQNVTDVDDPLFARARRDGVRWDELADREVSSFQADMAALGWRPPDAMPRVSQELPGILAAVDRLVEGGFAYRSGTVYFDVSRYPGYGQLSHRSRLSMLRKLRDEGVGAEPGPGAKRDPLDFPLWRPSEPDEPSWPSRHGPGRPGWHIECSAMAMRYLGDQVDVHGGGRDLAFSHHESERAQSESLSGRTPFARAWLHTGMVRYGGRKMSKSLGNLVLVPEVLDLFSAAALRLHMAAHRYRRDWSFTWTGLSRSARLARRLAALAGVATGSGLAGAPRDGGADLVAAFSAAMDDDLDTPRAVRALRLAIRRRDAAAARWMAGILCGDAALE